MELIREKGGKHSGEDPEKPFGRKKPSTVFEVLFNPAQSNSMKIGPREGGERRQSPRKKESKCQKVI